MEYRRLYIQNSYIFVTIVTSKRRKILVNNIDLLKISIKKSIDNYKYELYAICVLPDHIHMLIKPYDISDYPKIIKQIKTYFSKNIDKNDINDYELRKSSIKKHEQDIWQRRYWEHTIRNDEDLYRHTDYIHYNPIKHGYVKNVADWQYSSFKKFVKKGYYEQNWCNFGDKYKIDNLNVE